MVIDVIATTKEMEMDAKALWDVINEGGEGYRPAYARRATVKVHAPVASDRMLQDERGNLIPESKLRARLAKDEAKLPNITSESARAIVLASIEFARNQLA
jgi:hypothetical protein